MKNKAELVLVPTPATGDLVSIVELAKHLLDRHEHFSITVLLIKPFFFPSYNHYVESLATSENQLRYIHLPPPSPSEPVVPKSPEKFFSDYLESHKSQVREAITNHVLSSSPPTARLAGMVVDILCTAMIDVANEFATPTYLFFPSSAAFLGLMLHLPIRHALIGTEFTISDLNAMTHFPSYANPAPTSLLPTPLFNKDSGYACLLNHTRRFREATGIIINTFEELESHAMKSLLVSLESPSVDAIRPLLDLASKARSGSDRDKILKWLDEQPMSSVVFLCFGSLRCFDLPQLAEIAATLEKSGHWFLWSLRRPPPEDGLAMPTDYGGDHEGLLPEGFLKRTENRGMVYRWAPQTAVLGHAAVGGFVSHCGWNSILESLWFGVLIVTWPIYAEEQINAFEMVVDLDLAVELRLDCRDERGGGATAAEELRW